MHISNKYSWVKHIDFILIDSFCLGLSFVIAFKLRFDSFGFVNSRDWKYFVAIVLLLNASIAVFSCAYSGIVRCGNYQVLFRSLKLTFVNCFFSCVVFYMLKLGANYSRIIFFIMYIIYWGMSSIAKIMWLHILKKKGIARSKERSLFVITKQLAVEKLLDDIQAGEFNCFSVKAIYFYDKDDAVSEIDGIPVLKKDENYVEYILENGIDEILIDSRYIKAEEKQVQELNDNGIRINISIEGLIGIETDNQYINKVGLCKTLSVGDFSFSSQQVTYLLFKRFCDIVLGIFGCAFMVPVAILVKLFYVSMGDYAPIIYTQQRIGKDEKKINMYKFRSMVNNAEELLTEMLKDEKYRVEWEMNQKFINDPRITKIGRVLRKTSLDEVPQFINVLKGELSLIGPRPLVEGELEAHGGLKLYNKVKPGITGWWACNGRSNISYKERLEMEYYYVKNCSLNLDVLVLIRTVIGVVKKVGAV